MHKLLERQLRRVFGAAAVEASAALGSLLPVIDAAYVQSDQVRGRLELSLERVSEELYKRNRELRSELMERKQLEAELQQAQKLEAVGQLASGIAHEINTPIQFVGDSVQFIQDSLGTLLAAVERLRELARSEQDAASRRAAADALDEECDLAYLRENIPKAFERTLHGVGRVAAIVRAMKEFGHPDNREKAPVDINHCLANTLVVATNEIKYVADVETDFGDVALVPGRAGDLNQVFLNLLVNAAHAIGDANRGTDRRGKIRVATGSGPDYVECTIADTGCGVPDAIRSRIFEPFFTTKEVGRGTGQGLAIARSIVVDKHGGTITFESKVGVGTTFRVRLPLSGQPLAPRKGASSSGTLAAIASPLA